MSQNHEYSRVRVKGNPNEIGYAKYIEGRAVECILIDGTIEIIPPEVSDCKSLVCEYRLEPYQSISLQIWPTEKVIIGKLFIPEVITAEEYERAKRKAAKSGASRRHHATRI